jgi:hypothetical protein
LTAAGIGAPDMLTELGRVCAELGDGGAGKPTFGGFDEVAGPLEGGTDTVFLLLNILGFADGVGAATRVSDGKLGVGRLGRPAVEVSLCPTFSGD